MIRQHTKIGDCISDDMTLFFDIRSRDLLTGRIQDKVTDDLHYKINKSCLSIFREILNLRNSLSYLYYKNKTNNFEQNTY